MRSTVFIECVHGSHSGGAKQQNEFPLGNIFIFMQIFNNYPAKSRGISPDT